MRKMMLTTRSRRVVELVRERPAAQAENRAGARAKVVPHNPFHAVLNDGAWAGEPCFVIGGGPSLRGFDFERLRGRGRVIAINRAYEFAPFADMLFFMDNKFYKRCHEPRNIATWQAFQGYKVFLDLMGRTYDDCYHVRTMGRNGFSSSIARGLYHGNNSGVGALGIALCLRARPIYLLGYDMRFDGKNSHFHDGYGPRPHEGVVRSFCRDFERMAKHIPDKRGIVNLNPRSMLRIFPFGNIDEVLGDGKTRQGVGDDGSAVRAPELLPASA